MKQFFINLYKTFKIERLVAFFEFLFHRYKPKRFNPLHVPNNVRLLWQISNNSEVIANESGKLKLISKPLFIFLDILSLGAIRSRSEKAIFFTLLTLTLETYNPLNKKILKIFLNRKISFIERLTKHLEIVKGKKWWESLIAFHIDSFRRNSLLQERIVDQMIQAVSHQKKERKILEGQAALDQGLYPLLVTQGVSGAYWMRGKNRQVIGLFKPFDEEIHAPNNPIGPAFQGALGQRRTRAGCRVGEAAHHEVAAFVVDSYFGFGIVPRTYYASFRHKAFYLAREDRLSSRRSVKTKYGSFQEFIEGFVSLDRMAETEYKTALPLEEFQLLMMLDLIIGNTDRNMGNILIGDEKIAAIDHGLSFPDRPDHLSYWYWAYLNHGKTPLFPAFIDLLNNFPYGDLGEKLRHKCFISLSSINRMRERIALFKEGIAAGFVPAQLEKLMTHEYLYPLVELKITLDEKAREQIERYKKWLDENPPSR